MEFNSGFKGLINEVGTGRPI